MCGRFARYAQIEALIAILREALPDLDASTFPQSQPSYNIAPSQPILTIGRSLPEHPHKFALLRWGFVPSWCKQLMAGKMEPQINARGETVHESKMFMTAFNKRRCLVVANGFYEWQKQEGGGRKKPHFICVKDDAIFGFAGIYETTQAYGAPVTTVAILTTEANKLVKPIHHRMPVIIEGKDFALWCDPEKLGADVAQLLIPFPAERMEAFEVADRVNKPANNDRGLILPFNTR